LKPQNLAFENKKGRILISGFILSSWDKFCVSHDFQQVDMLGIIEAAIRYAISIISLFQLKPTFKIIQPRAKR
jgi:hypothetical protein